MKYPNTTYAKMVSKETGEIFAYFVRTNDFEFPEPMELWIGAVFVTWTISDVEFETYAKGFEIAPIITFDDFAVIALVECYRSGDYEEIEFGGTRWINLPGEGPWYFEATPRVETEDGHHH